MIEFEGEFESSQSREKLWTYFTDPDILADSAPGVESMDMESPYELSAVMAVGVGSVKPTFNVDVTVTEAEEPAHLDMTASGEASRNSFETVAEMNLLETEEGGTLFEWRAEANVSGLIASMGQRALNSVAKRLVSNFFENIENLAQEGVETNPRLEGKPDAEADLES